MQGTVHSAISFPSTAFDPAGRKFFHGLALSRETLTGGLPSLKERPNKRGGTLRPERLGGVPLLLDSGSRPFKPCLLSLCL